jgi:hypothetical protein
MFTSYFIGGIYFMPAFMIIFALPLVFLKWIAPIVSVVWLIYLGDYNILITGIIAGLISVFAYALAMIPAMALLVPGAMLIQRGSSILKALGYFVLSVGRFWNYVLMAGWTLYVFGYSPEAIEARSLPYLLFAYGVSIHPFSYMASKEDSDNWHADFATLLNQLSTAILLILLVFSNLEIISIVAIFALVVVFGYVIGLFSGLLSPFRQSPENSYEE